MVYHQLAKQNRRKSSRGTAIMEFAIVMTIMIPLFCGMALVGLSSTTGIQAAQTTRDIGHMYSLGIDFSAATTNDEDEN